MSQQYPRFAIVNTMDRPERRLIAEYIPGVGYCYMQRHNEPRLKQFDGMTPDSPTAIEEFGFEVEVLQYQANFSRHHESTAQYMNGDSRDWQDSSVRFSLPLVNTVELEGEE